MWVDIVTSERFRPLRRFRWGTKTLHALPPLATPPPVDRNILITTNGKDFKESELPVLTPDEYLTGLKPK